MKMLEYQLPFILLIIGFMMIVGGEIAGTPEVYNSVKREDFNEKGLDIQNVGMVFILLGGITFFGFSFKSKIFGK